MKPIDRRTFLASSAALAAVGSATLGGLADSANAEEPKSARRDLPKQGEFVIDGATLITMDEELGTISNGSIHIRAGEIVSMGSAIESTGSAARIDGSDSIVMPGLVDTHWHLWNTILRSNSGEQKGKGYFRTVGLHGKHMSPDAMRASSLLAAAEAISGGITTVTNWCHNARTIDHARADIGAMSAAGIRGRFYCGWGQGHSDEQAADMSLVESLKKDWAALDGGGLLDLGFGWRGMHRATALPEAVYRADFEAARALELPISVHVGNSVKATGQIGQLADRGFLGPWLQIVHALSATKEEIKRVKDAGTSFSATPGSEMRIGFGLPKVGEFIQAGVPTGIGVDSVSLTGNANLFEILRWTRNVEKAKTLDEAALPAPKALAIATVGAARSLGLDDRIGTLVPGRRADLIMISTDALNLGAIADPLTAAIECTQPANIDTVVIDGRILKRGGKLVHLDRDQLIGDARAALRQTQRQAGTR